jgi:hypothetical protein
VQTPQYSSTFRGGDFFVAVVDNLLGDGIGVRFRAGGSSMTPTVRDGEYVIVTPLDRSHARTNACGSARVDVGDIVLCQMRRGPVAHRVVAITSSPDGSPRYTLCGDAAPDCDRSAGADQLRGKVVSVERDGDRVSLAIAGGRLGKVALLGALTVRRSILAALTRRPAAPLTPSPYR